MSDFSTPGHPALRLLLNPFYKQGSSASHTLANCQNIPSRDNKGVLLYWNADFLITGCNLQILKNLFGTPA